MVEITSVLTVELTYISEHNDGTELGPQMSDNARHMVENDIKQKLGIDHVQILKENYFVIDKQKRIVLE